MVVTIKTSVGDLVDRLTILSIKLEKITDKSKLDNVKTEYELLDAEFKTIGKTLTTDQGVELIQTVAKLKEVNETIWRVEDDIRDHERRQDFGKSFVQLARSVYIFNDRRASIKRTINDLLGSKIVEEKSYADYTGTKS